MGITTRKLTLCAALGIAGLLSASCNSTSTAAEEPVATQEARASSTLSLPAAEAPEKETEPSTAADPYADRAVPFSEERVEALEGSLRPLDSVPVPEEALPAPKDKGVAQRS